MAVHRVTFCPRCSSEVGADAGACPRCSVPLPSAGRSEPRAHLGRARRRSTSAAGLWAGAVVAVLLAGGGVYLFTRSPLIGGETASPPAPASEPVPAEAHVAPGGARLRGRTLAEWHEILRDGVARAGSAGNLWLEAVGAVGEFGADAWPAVPQLTAALEGEPGMTGQPHKAAAWSLGRVGARAAGAVPALLRVLRTGAGKGRLAQDLSVSDAAAVALRRILPALGPASAGHVPALVEALGDKDAEVRSNAAGVLGDMGSLAREAVPALERLANMKPGEYEVDVSPWSAREALEKIRPK